MLDQIKGVIARPVFDLGGLQITVGALALLAAVAFFLLKRR